MSCHILPLSYNVIQMIDLLQLVWDDWNVPRIERHGVAPEDVEAACHADSVLYRRSYKNRLMLLGETPAGRVLAIVIGPVPGAPTGTYYSFTARPANRRERIDYNDLKRGPTS